MSIKYEGNVVNPIVRGFYPDPSVCEAEGKYYLVCSTFEYFPGVPVFESDDLVNWKQVANVFTRPSQIDLKEVNSSGGVFAPTIRYNDGVFYMVTNNNTYQKNLYVTTTDIRGEWSEPIFVDQEGIDPSLHFENGKAYFVSNGSDENGDGCILCCEIDIKTGEKLTKSTPIWSGSGGRYLESPHLYHIGDYYYIMAAEGGTEYGHMITYARGKSPFGPFEDYADNPVITNRDLGGNLNRIQAIGHGDLIQGPDGQYYIICLGFRQNGEWSPFHHLGREVYITPVEWENGWFKAKQQKSVGERVQIDCCKKQEPMDYSVSTKTLYEDRLRVLFLRQPDFDNYKFEEDRILLRQSRITINDTVSPTFAGVRQSQFNTKLKFAVSVEDGEAGFTFYLFENAHFDLFLSVEDEQAYACLRLCEGDLKTVVAKVPLSEKKAVLKAESDAMQYRFFAEGDFGEDKLGTATARMLSSEVNGGFTGVVGGLYAQNPDGKCVWAEFTDFNWKQEY